MMGRDVPKPTLPHERQIAVVGVHACGALCAQNRVCVRRNVDVQIFEPEEVRSGGVGDRSHPIYPDPGDVLQTVGTIAHCTIHFCRVDYR